MINKMSNDYWTNEKYYENPEIIHLGTEESRSYYLPYAPGEMPDSDSLQSQRKILLNGNWDFKYYPNPYVVEDFSREGYRYENYDTIPVPGCWQMYGYDKHQYVNAEYPFPYDPPYVPAQNPCGVYHYELHIVKGAMRIPSVLKF